jgi:hypothetical protein
MPVKLSIADADEILALFAPANGAGDVSGEFVGADVEHGLHTAHAERLLPTTAPHGQGGQVLGAATDGD